MIYYWPSYMRIDLVTNQLKLISPFLFERRYRTKINPAYSGWEDLLISVPQGSVLGLCYLTFTCAIFSSLSLNQIKQIMQMIRLCVNVKQI